MDRHDFTLAQRPAFCILPAHSDIRPLRWVWYAPTLPGLPGEAEQWMFDLFLAAGVAIAGIDVGESYGSPDGRELFTALHRHVVETRGFSNTPCLLGRSRGALMLYNWAVEHPESVAAIAGIYPVCNLASWPGLETACTAYGMTPEQLAAELPGHNPVDRLGPLAAAGVPIFHIHGDTDELVPLPENSALLAERYRALGGQIELRIPPGQGHNMWPGFFECQPLVDFVLTNARPSHDA